MDHVNWGILGAAKFARTDMAPALHQAAGGRLHALATRDAQKAQPFLAQYPDLVIHDSYDALLADPMIHAVYIPLPHTMHIEWAQRAAAAGKHVLVEKPLAMTAAQIDPLIETRDKTGLVITEAFMIIHHPQWQMARDLLAQGAIGDLRHVRAAFSYDNSNDPQNIRNHAATGGGSLPDIGVYTIGSTRFATAQNPTEILDAQFDYDADCEVSVEARAQFSGFRAHWVTSMRMAPFQEIVFHGRRGVMRLTCPYNPTVFDQARLVIETGMTRQETRFPSANQYVLQVENVNAAIRRGAELRWTLEEAHATQSVIDAIRKKGGDHSIG